MHSIGGLNLNADSKGAILAQWLSNSTVVILEETSVLHELDAGICDN
jgi:hypothetical protein